MCLNNFSKFESIVTLYLPFITFLDGKKIIHKRKQSRDKSDNGKRLTIDIRKPFCEIKLNSNTEYKNKEKRKASTDSKASIFKGLNPIGNFKTLNPKKSIIELKKSSYNMHNELIESSLSDIKKLYFKQGQKKPLLLKDNLDRTTINDRVERYLTARNSQKPCNETLIVTNDKNEDEVRKIYNEKKSEISNIGRNRSQTFVYNIIGKQPKESNDSKVNELQKKAVLIKEDKKQPEELLIKENNESKKEYIKTIRSSFKNAIKTIMLKINDKFSRSEKKFKKIEAKLKKYKNIIKKNYIAEMNSKNVMKSAVDILREEKRKLEASYSELEEQNKYLKVSLMKCKLNIENGCDSERYEEKSKNDEYNAMASEILKLSTECEKLQEKIELQTNIFNNEKEEQLNTIKELEDNIKLIKDSHEKEIKRMGKENSDRIIGLEFNLKSVIDDRDTILSELCGLKRSIENYVVRIDRGTMTSEDLIHLKPHK